MTGGPPFEGNLVQTGIAILYPGQDPPATDSAQYRRAQAWTKSVLVSARGRAYVHEIRSEALELARLRMRSWAELLPDAQATLARAARGILTFDGVDPKSEAEMIRSAVRAAQFIVERVEGPATLVHAERLASRPGGGVAIIVAGPGQDARVIDAAYTVDVARRLGPGDGEAPEDAG